MTKTEPSIHLYAGRPYVPSHEQKSNGILSRWLWERSCENPANYPDYAEQYERDQIAEHAGMQHRNYR